MADLEKAIKLVDSLTSRCDYLVGELMKLQKENAELKEEIETMKDQRELETIAMAEAAWYDD